MITNELYQANLGDFPSIFHSQTPISTVKPRHLEADLLYHIASLYISRTTMNYNVRTKKTLHERIGKIRFCSVRTAATDIVLLDSASHVSLKHCSGSLKLKQYIACPNKQTDKKSHGVKNKLWPCVIPPTPKTAKTQRELIPCLVQRL